MRVRPLRFDSCIGGEPAWVVAVRVVESGVCVDMVKPPVLIRWRKSRPSRPGDQAGHPL
jgi:hypothetical protein